MNLSDIKTQETAKNVSVSVTDITTPNKPNIHVTGYVDTYSGYGEHCRAVLNGLNGTGKYNIKLTDLKCAKNVSPQVTSKYRNNIYFHNFNYEDSIYLGITAPGYMQEKLIPKCKKSFTWTMTETNEVPNMISDLSKNVDTIICPTYIDKDKFNRAGVLNTTVCPLGYDETLYNSETPRLDIVNLRGRYVFGSVGSWNARKNQQAIIKAFVKNYRSSDNTTLLFVSKYAVRDYEGKIFNTIEEELKHYIESARKEYNVSESDLPHIALYDGTLHENVMPMMMSRIDCLVGASTGESTWLPALHMAAIGRPIIQASNPNAGYMEYLHKNPYMVDEGVNAMATPEFYLGISEYYKDCYMFFVDPEALGEMMLKVDKDHNTSAQNQAIQAVRAEVTDRTWKTSVGKLINILF